MGMIISYWLGRKNQESNYNKLKEHSDALQRVVDNKPIQYYNYTIYFSYRHYSGQMFSKTHTKYDTVTMTLPYEIEVVGTAHQPLLAYINSVARKDNSRIIRFEKNK